jgi:hypothetical protein
MASTRQIHQMSIKDHQNPIRRLYQRCIDFFSSQQQIPDEPEEPIDPHRIWALNGKSAIYFESKHIFHISISSVQETENGFLVTATPIKTPGLFFADRSLSFGGAWENLSFRRKRIAIYGYISWELFTDPNIIDQVLAIAAEMPEGQTYLDDYTTSPIPSDTKLLSNKVSGAIAKRLYDLLRY